MTKTKEMVILLLATQLGVENADISEEDSLRENLMMKITDFTDIMETLEKRGINVSELNFKKITTVGDLIDFIDLEGEL